VRRVDVHHHFRQTHPVESHAGSDRLAIFPWSGGSRENHIRKSIPNRMGHGDLSVFFFFPSGRFFSSYGIIAPFHPSQSHETLNLKPYVFSPRRMHPQFF
jgi:hypothetical protein